MKKKLKLKITTVREQTIKLPDTALHARCSACNRQVEMLTPAHAAEILQISADALDDLITAGRVHTLETISGSLLVCKDSLLLR